MLTFLPLLLALAIGAEAFTARSLPRSRILPTAVYDSRKRQKVASRTQWIESRGGVADEQPADDHETLLARLGGEAALEAAVNNFYDRVVAEEGLAQFFEGADMDQLRAHQYNFMKLAFSDIPEELDVGAYITNSHERLLKEEGLNADHFDIVAGHLVGTLQDMGVADNLVDEVVATVGPLRGVFPDKEE